jgi:hypothetical protein
VRHRAGAAAAYPAYPVKVLVYANDVLRFAAVSDKLLVGERIQSPFLPEELDKILASRIGHDDLDLDGRNVRLSNHICISSIAH